MERLAPLEVGLYALVCTAPLAIGGVHPPSQLLLAAAALALLLVAGAGPLRANGLRVAPLAWVMMAALGWTALQLLPLPLVVLRAISPEAATLREEVGARWAPITMDAPATALALVRQLAVLCVLLLGSELLRKRSAGRAAAVLGLFGGLMTLLIVGHRSMGADKIYGWYELHSQPGSGFFAPFVNGNHAASLLSLCALAAAGTAMASVRGTRALFSVLAVAAGLATLATMSRGGAVGLGLGLVILVTLVATAQLGRTRGIILSLCVVAVIAAGGLFLADGLRGRFTQHAQGESLAQNQKTRGWLAALELTWQHAYTGVGRGAFEAPAARLRVKDEQVRLVYPENAVLQRLSEWGYPMGLGLLVAFGLSFVVVLRRLRKDPVLTGLTAGVVAVGVHELSDFGLEFPGVALPLTLAVAALVAHAESDHRARRRPRLRLRGVGLVGVALAGIAVIALGAMAAPHTLDAELEALRAAVDSRDPGVKAAIDAACARHPASGELEVLAGEEALRRRDTSALRRLGRAMRLTPAAPRPHHLAALELLRVRRMQQAALELRLALERGANIADSELVRLVGSAAVDAVPHDPDALMRLGAEYARLGRWDDLERAYLRAAELDPGPRPRQRWLALLPPARGAVAAEAMARAAASGEELALAISAFAAAGQPARAEAVLEDGLKRYPGSAAPVVAGARLRLQRGDLDGARQLIGRSARFDVAGRILIEELRVELAEKAGDREGVLAARARLRLLRQRADLDEPANGATQ